jgi:hypothetical protein
VTAAAAQGGTRRPWTSSETKAAFIPHRMLKESPVIPDNKKHLDQRQKYC